MAACVPLRGVRPFLCCAPPFLSSLPLQQFHPSPPQVVHFRVDPPAPTWATRAVRSVAGRNLPTPRAAAAYPGPVTFTIQVDFDGAAGHRGGDYMMEPWSTLATVTVNASASDLGASYAYYTFPDGFSAHWVRFVASADCNATAYLTYT